MKARVKVSASSANLGVGFDALGIGLDIYNIYEFETSNEFQLINFNGYEDNNLLKVSYIKLFEYFGLDLIPSKITQIECNIDIARGLGSSAALIVSGIIGASLVIKDKYNKEISYDELLNVATIIEGHPDNVAPALFGGLISSNVTNNHIYYHKYEVSDKLHFYLLIPNFSLETVLARSAISKEISFNDYKDNLSKAILLPLAFSEGNLGKIKDLTRNAIHEKYRYPLIKGGLKLKEELESENNVILISGAGPSLLLITDCEKEIKISNKDFRVVKTSINNKGVEIEYGI